jgi:3-hydroxyacyl-[acyl-carrier-protein] dehydratase
MLSGSFFEVLSLKAEDRKLEAVLQINAAHPIFEGHFPGQPVVPGVCMLQMVKEVLEKKLGAATTLSAADNIKFLTVINPVENNRVSLELKYSTNEDSVPVNATLFTGATIYFKMRGVFTINKKV